MIAVVVSGYTMGLGVVRSLGRRGVPIILGQYDHGDMAQYPRYVSETVRLPHPNDDQVPIGGDQYAHSMPTSTSLSGTPCLRHVGLGGKEMRG